MDDFREHQPDTNGICNGSLVPSCSKDVLEESEEDEEVSQMFSKTQFVVPSKSQVLYYISSSASFRVLRTGLDLQVTDRTGFPLLDVWPERTCFSEIWIVESYGSQVLIVAERNVAMWSPFKRRGICAQTATDWNGDVVGHLLPGSPFLIQNANRTTIARCVVVDCSETRPQHVSWSCLLETSGRECARLESTGLLSFSCDVGFQLKLLIVVALARTRAVNPRKSLCWPLGVQ